jgi:hypothetical protein
METESAATKYEIYKITLPGVSSYIGLTKIGVNERWKQHLKVAKRKPTHPLYAAINANSEEDFEVSVLATCETKEEASKLEVSIIAEHGLANLFNISPGGDYDMLIAGKCFWEHMYKNPEARKAYIAKLCVAQKSRPKEAHAHLYPASVKWRKDNPKLAYKLALRGVRVAAKANTTTGVNSALRDAKAAKPLKEKLLEKHKSKFLVKSRAVSAVWASRSEDERKELAAKISGSVKKLYDDPSIKGKNEQQLQLARASIDRTVQVAAAKAGIKKYWDDLKSDPVRYAAEMAKRKASAEAKKR